MEDKVGMLEKEGRGWDQKFWTYGDEDCLREEGKLGIERGSGTVLVSTFRL